MIPLLLDWLRDPVANECPYNAQQLRDLAHDEIVLLRTEVGRLRDNLHTIAADQFDTLDECMNFANTCWRASGVQSSSSRSE